MTADAFRTLLRESDRRLELVEGAIVEMPPSSRRNTIIAGLIAHFLNAFVLPRDLGYVTVADGGFEINAINTFQPDATFIQKARVSSLDGVTFDVAPDLAVEVISPSESTRQIHHKVTTYLQGGTRVVWVVYPDEAVVEVWTLGTDDAPTLLTLTQDESLDGRDILPGFTLPIAHIFPD